MILFEINLSDSASTIWISVVVGKPSSPHSQTEPWRGHKDQDQGQGQGRKHNRWKGLRLQPEKRRLCWGDSLVKKLIQRWFQPSITFSLLEQKSLKPSVVNWCDRLGTTNADRFDMALKTELWCHLQPHAPPALLLYLQKLYFYI